MMFITRRGAVRSPRSCLWVAQLDRHVEVLGPQLHPGGPLRKAGGCTEFFQYAGRKPEQGSDCAHACDVDRQRAIGIHGKERISETREPIRSIGNARCFASLVDCCQRKTLGLMTPLHDQVEAIDAYLRITAEERRAKSIRGMSEADLGVGAMTGRSEDEVGQLMKRRSRLSQPIR